MNASEAIASFDLRPEADGIYRISGGQLTITDAARNAGHFADDFHETVLPRPGKGYQRHSMHLTQSGDGKTIWFRMIDVPVPRS